MSVRRQDFGSELEMYVDTEKTFQLSIIDPETNDAQDLTNTTIFSTGVVKIYKPDGTIISTSNITYIDRAGGVVEFTMLETDSVLANAGNWIGDLELVNTSSKIVDQQKFNFNILVSY